MIATQLLLSALVGLMSFMAAAGVLSQLAPDPRGRAVGVCMLTLVAFTILGMVSGWEIGARALS